MQTIFLNDDNEIENKLRIAPDNYDELDRKDKIIAISNDISQINHLMQTISELVHKQQEKIDTVTDNIDESKVIIQIANRELIAADINNSNYRKKLSYLGIGIMTLCLPVTLGIKAGALLIFGGIGLKAGYNYVKN